LDNRGWVEVQNEWYAATYGHPLGERKDPVENGGNGIRIMESRQCAGSRVEMRNMWKGPKYCGQRFHWGSILKWGWR